MQQEKQVGWAMRMLGWLGTFFVLSGVAAQLFLIHLFIGHHYATPGESRAWEGMGLLALIFLSLFVVVPGTFIAVYRTVRSALQYRNEGAVPAVLNLSVALLPLVVYQVLVWSDTKPSPPREYRNPVQSLYDKRPPEWPVTPQGEKLGGAEFAINNGIETVSGCSQGSADFIAGCVEYVKRQPKRDKD